MDNEWREKAKEVIRKACCNGCPLTKSCTGELGLEDLIAQTLEDANEDGYETAKDTISDWHKPG